MYSESNRLGHLCDSHLPRCTGRATISWCWTVWQPRADLAPEQLRLLADRHFGVGCDQILLVEPTAFPDADFRYRIFNADGGSHQRAARKGSNSFVRPPARTNLPELSTSNTTPRPSPPIVVVPKRFPRFIAE